MKAIISLNLKNTLKISVSKIKFIKTTDLMPEEIISKINNKYSIIIQKKTLIVIIYIFLLIIRGLERRCAFQYPITILSVSNKRST